MVTKPATKQLNSKQKEILARKLGYDGPMNMFEEFIKSDPAMSAKYSTVVEKYMAKGGMARKYAEGGYTPPQADPETRQAQIDFNAGRVYRKIVDPAKQTRLQRDIQLNKDITAARKTIESSYKNDVDQIKAAFAAGTIDREQRDQLEAQAKEERTSARAALDQNFAAAKDANTAMQQRDTQVAQQLANDVAAGKVANYDSPAFNYGDVIANVTLPSASYTMPSLLTGRAAYSAVGPQPEEKKETPAPAATTTAPAPAPAPAPTTTAPAPAATVTPMVSTPTPTQTPTTTPTPTSPSVPVTTPATLSPTPVPQQTFQPDTSGPVDAPKVPELVAATVPTSAEQLVSSQAAPATASTITPTLAGETALAAPAAPREAATTEAVTATPEVTTALAGVQPVTGTVSDQALVQAETMEPTSTKVSDLTAATDEAALVQAPAARTVQEGELVSGPTVDMGRVEETLSQAQAAQGVVTDEMTVAGQIQKLTANFDATNPPTWAAGAIRNVNAVLTQRGMGASSLAGQAIVQAALESALPIAAADAKIYQEMGIQNLANRQQMAVLTAQQRAAFLGQEFDQAFQTRVTNAATISEIANINFTAEQQIALENARLTNTVNLANLSNKQALIMAEAAQIANLETTNLNNRQQAAVLNAQAFLQMDMANLANEQQTELFKAQSMVNSLLTDAAAENAARQFNASSINQVNQFYDGLTAQIQQFNASQANAMNQFNVSQVNSVAQFNASSQNARDQFNAEYRRIIDQSNVEWRRNIALADTAAVNRANEINAANALGITTIDYNNTWQQYRDSLEMAWKTSEGAMDREVQLALGVLSKQAAIESAKFAVEAEKAKALGALAAVGLDKSGLFAAGGAAVVSALSSGKTGTVGTGGATSNQVTDYFVSGAPWVQVPNSADLGGGEWGTFYDGDQLLEINYETDQYYVDGVLRWEPNMPEYSASGEIYPDGSYAGAE